MSDFGYDIDDTGSGASGFSFGVMFSVTAFLLIIVILFACTRLCLNQPPRRSRAFRSTDQNSALRPTDRYPTTIRQGLDEATLNSYPKLLYTEIKKANSTASCCSICLLDYKETDVLRALPDCAHLFHLNCIDPWMRLHPTCPICRTAPVRVPVQLPSVEVVQLAAREAS